MTGKTVIVTRVLIKGLKVPTAEGVSKSKILGLLAI